MLSSAARKAREHHVQPADLREAAGSVRPETFDLDASCYASVCLGEIMKCNLSYRLNNVDFS